MINQDMIAAIAAQAEQADWDADVEAALTRPTVSTLSELLTHPQRVESIAASLGAYSDGRRMQNLTDAASLASILHHGKTDLALRFLYDRKKALATGGNRDGTPPKPGDGPQTTEVTDTIIGHLKSDDPQRHTMAKGLAGMVMALTLDPEDVGKGLAQAGFEDDRADDEVTA